MEVRFVYFVFLRVWGREEKYERNEPALLCELFSITFKGGVVLPNKSKVEESHFKKSVARRCLNSPLKFVSFCENFRGRSKAVLCSW